MSLTSYLRNSWLREHETSRQEISNLLAISDRDIQQSQVPGLGAEWRFDIAYNAALQASTAALAAAGYRAERANKHMRVIECLEFTIGLDKADVRFLDTCRRKRHIAVYQQVGAISEEEASELIEFAIRLRAVVEEWLQRVYPDLLGDRPG